MSGEPESEQQALYQLRRAAGAGTAIPELSRACLIRLIDFPELPLRTHTREVIKADLGTLVVRSDLALHNQRIPVAYKRVRRVGWLREIVDVLRQNRSVRSWRIGQTLLQRGIQTARPLAVIVSRRHWLRQYTYVATEWLEGAVQVDEFLHQLQHCRRELRTQLERSTTLSLSRLLGRMHAANVSHRDLKVSNLMLRQSGSHVEAFVIDLDGVALRPWISRRTRLKNLARLAICFEHDPRVRHSMRLRFLQNYLRELPTRESDWKLVWRQLAVATQRLWLRKQRRDPGRFQSTHSATAHKSRAA